MFDEEQEIINHEVESDDSIEIMNEMPIQEPLRQEPENKQKSIEIIDETQIELKQTEKVMEQQVEKSSNEAQQNQDGGLTQQNLTQPSYFSPPTSDTQGCRSTQPNELKAPSTFVSIFKKQSLKQLVRITSKMTDNEIEQIDQKEKKLKQNPEIMVDDDDVVFQDVNTKWTKNLNEKDEIKKQKQWQLMASHFATQPDFIDAALAFTENHKKGAPPPVKPSILNKRGRSQAGQTKSVTIQDRPFEQLPPNQPSYSNAIVIDAKTNGKSGPGRKKKGGKQVSFQEPEGPTTSVSHRGIEYIKTSVTPEVQKVLQTEPQLIQQNQQIPQPQSDKSQQQFVPPYASSNQLNQISSTENKQQLSHQQASQQSFQYKYLNMAQQLQVRTETSPKRVRDMITQQYMSSYQIEQPKNLPFRQQPIFQQQEMERQMQYEINEKKRQEEKLKKKNPQYAIDSKREKNEKKLESKVKIQQITQAQQSSSEKQRVYDIIDSDDQMDIIEETSQDFIDFKQKEDRIDFTDKEPLKPTFWKPIQGTEDIPIFYYFQKEYQKQQQQINIDESKAQPLNLFRLFFNDHIIDLILKNNKELDCTVLDQFLAVQILQVLSQIQGNTEIYDSMKYEHLMETTLFTFWEDKLQLNQIVDNQMFLDQFNMNLLKYYNSDELLILDRSIFDSDVSKKSTFLLSDATKGYIFSIKDLDLTNYQTMNSQIITLLQPFTDQLNKVLLNEYINNPELVNNLKQKSIGSLGRVQPIYSMLTNEQMENIDVRKNKPSYYLSTQDSILLLAMNLENLYLTSFNDLKKSIKNEKETEFIIIIMINNLTKAQQKRTEMFSQLANKKKDYINTQMNLFTTCLYSALWNASIIQRHLAKQQNQQEEQDKLTQKDWFISYTVQLMHQMTVLVYQIQQIQSIPNNHKLIYGQLNLCCQQCGKITKQLCQDCSNQFKKLIVVCVDEECYQYHTLLNTYFQDKNQAEIIKTSEAINLLKQYKAKLLSEKQNETYKKAIETLDSTLENLEIQDPDQLISQQLATMLQQLKSMIQLTPVDDDEEEDEEEFSQDQNQNYQNNEDRRSQQSLNNRIEINSQSSDQKQTSNKVSNQIENQVQQISQEKETKPQLTKQKKVIGKLQVVKYSQQ